MVFFLVLVPDPLLSANTSLHAPLAGRREVHAPFLFLQKDEHWMTQACSRAQRTALYTCLGPCFGVFVSFWNWGLDKYVPLCSGKGPSILNNFFTILLEWILLGMPLNPCFRPTPPCNIRVCAHHVTPSTSRIPRHTMPHHVALHCTAPDSTAPHRTTPHHTTPHHTTPHHTTPHHTTPHHTTPHHTTPHHTTPRRGRPLGVLFRAVTALTQILCRNIPKWDSSA